MIEHVGRVRSRGKTLSPEAPEKEEQRSTTAAPSAAHKLPSFSLRLKRVPVTRQMSIMECGAACLAMILSYYGSQVSIAEINERCGTGRDGLSALDIVKAARHYGLQVEAISLNNHNLRGIALPAIVHWEFNHFMVVERWSPTKVQVVDPAQGRRELTNEEFSGGFTGVTLIMKPGETFVKRKSSLSRVTLFTYAAQYLKRAPGVLGQILIASLILQLLGLGIPLLTKVFIDMVIPQGAADFLNILGLGMFVILLTQFVVTILRTSLLVHLQARIDSHMIPNFLKHLLSLPYDFFLKHSNGDLLTRYASQATVRDTLSSQLVSSVLDGSTVLVYLVILFMALPIFGAIVLLIGLVQVLMLLFSSSFMMRLSRVELEARGKEQGYINEVLEGIETLKATGIEHRAFARWSNLFLTQLNASLERGYFTSIISTCRSAIQTMAPLALLWIGTMQVINGTMQVGTMLALNALATAFLTPLSSLVNSAQQLQTVRANLERLADILETHPEQYKQQVQEPPRLKGNIQLEHVNFQYDPQGEAILKDISLTIQSGQKVAIVGRTGSGKSTLGRLLLGLYQPNAGAIYYDNLPAKSFNYQAMRAQFGVVLQHVSIFSGSIRQNITLDLPNITFDQVQGAARIAALHEDIMKMPMGYETFVSENGKALSGGQRQRLALARALVQKPAILLLDEATSALDVETELTIEQNLRALACTQIIIAHRLSTIRNADCILVLDNGKIVEQGTHEELIRANGQYAQLIHNQLAKGEIVA